MLDTLHIAFIGGGNMASALIGGLIKQGAQPAHITVVEPFAEARERLGQQFGVTVLAQPDASLQSSQVIVLAVKPQQLRDAALALQPCIHQQLVMSVAAGIRLQDLQRWLGGHSRLVRAMPNTPALIGAGVTGLAALAEVSPQERAIATQIAAAVGSSVWVENEALIDSITALSGSGPAYVFYFIEAMQQAATELGLSAEQGRDLAVGTFIGAAQLAAQSTEPASTLRERVTSKGGTTYAALTSMEAAGMKAAFVQAMHAAAARGKAMGEEFGRDPT